MPHFSVEAIVAIAGLVVTLPPSAVLLWSLIKRKRKDARDIEVQ
jgi:hypothetical protein